MDYVRKNDSPEATNQDSELVKINTNSNQHSINENQFINNSLSSEALKINVINNIDISINTNFNNTLFYNHNDDKSKVNSTIRNQRIIFIPLICIKIFLPFYFYTQYFLYEENDNIKEQDIIHSKYFSYSIIILIYMSYFLSVFTSSQQMKIEKFIFRKLNQKDNNTNKNINEENDIENILNNEVSNFINKDEKLSEEIKFFDLKNYNQVCNYCHIRTFIRATHCLICDECVLFKQEHCPYIANCIGINNVQFFINFLFWTIFGLVYYMIICLVAFIHFNLKINIVPLIILISDFAMDLMMIKSLVQKFYNLMRRICYNLTQYEENLEENEPSCREGRRKSHNLFNIGFINHLYYIIGPTPLHFLFPIPKIKNYGNEENNPIFLKCKFPNRLELVKFLSKRNPKYKELLSQKESDPNNYIKLCHDFYDNKNIE